MTPHERFLAVATQRRKQKNRVAVAFSAKNDCVVVASCKRVVCAGMQNGPFVDVFAIVQRGRMEFVNQLSIRFRTALRAADKNLIYSKVAEDRLGAIEIRKKPHRQTER